jgi:hypothetical protein
MHSYVESGTNSTWGKSVRFLPESQGRAKQVVYHNFSEIQKNNIFKWKVHRLNEIYPKGLTYATQMNLYNLIFWMVSICNFSCLIPYLIFAPYIIEQIPKYLGTRNKSLIFRHDFFCWCVDCYMNLYKSPILCYGSFLKFPTFVSITWSVWCDKSELFSKFHFWKQKIHSRCSVFPHMRLSSLYSAVIFFLHPIHLKQFTAVQFQSYHLNWVDSSSFVLIRLRIVLRHIHESV